MPATVTINGAQRQVFYEMLTAHLSGAGDLGILLGREEFAEAERLGIELAEDLRLMEDLGWHSEFRERDVDLTMPPEDLAEMLTRLRSDAEGGLAEKGDEREARESDDAARRSYRLAFDTCNGLLTLLARCGDRQ
ncbi:MAG: hypothetical protein WD404_04675 [Solirubrobacterales bacterium]